MQDQMDGRIEELNSTPVAPVQFNCSRTYTVTEIQDILGICQSTAYLLIKSGVFHSVKVGRHIRISKASFDAWLEGTSSEVKSVGD